MQSLRLEIKDSKLGYTVRPNKKFSNHIEEETQIKEVEYIIGF